MEKSEDMNFEQYDNTICAKFQIVSQSISSMFAADGLDEGKLNLFLFASPVLLDVMIEDPAVALLWQKVIGRRLTGLRTTGLRLIGFCNVTLLRAAGARYDIELPLSQCTINLIRMRSWSKTIYSLNRSTDALTATSRWTTVFPHGILQYCPSIFWPPISGTYFPTAFKVLKLPGAWE